MGLAVRMVKTAGASAGADCIEGGEAMTAAVTREIVEVLAAMQAKALAFDSEHPDHALGARSPAEYAAAIRALVPEHEELQVGEWMLAAGAEAMRLLMLSYADTRRAI